MTECVHSCNSSTHGWGNTHIQPVPGFQQWISQYFTLMLWDVQCFFSDWDEWDDKYTSNVSSLDDGISPEDDHDTAWDYNYAWVQAMIEHECEQKDKDCVTNLTLNQSCT